MEKVLKSYVIEKMTAGVCIVHVIEFNDWVIFACTVNNPSVVDLTAIVSEDIYKNFKRDIFN